MEHQFSLEVFKGAFEKNLKKLANAEKITKDLLRDMSRDVLEALHNTEDISYVNRLVGKLTPVNRKVAILFYKEFSGFNYDDDEAEFGKKNKKKYDDIKRKAMQALEDPHFNLWTWADRNVTVDQKPLDVNKIKQFMERTLKKADEEGIPQAQILEAVLGAGFEVSTLLAVMGKMYPEDVTVKTEAE